MSLRDARRVGRLCAVVAIGALASFQAASASAGAAGTSRFSNRGISFSYPSSWYLTTRPLSNGVEPVYRFAVGNFRFHRTSRDVGPCLEGIARQRTAGGVLAFMREATGGDARRSRVAPRPAAFQLPTPSDQAACLGPGSNQVAFRQGGRVFYLWISIAPKAPAIARTQLAELLDSMKIAKVASAA